MTPQNDFSPMEQHLPCGGLSLSPVMDPWKLPRGSASKFGHSQIFCFTKCSLSDFPCAEAAALSPSFVFLLRGPAALGKNGWQLDDMVGHWMMQGPHALAKCFAHSMLRPLKAARLRSKSTPGNWERQWMVFKRLFREVVSELSPLVIQSASFL